MQAFLFTIALIAAAPIATPDAVAEPTRTEANTARADHPAIAARRVIAAQGYDYASKFYPHPAGFYLSAEAPREMSQHPAVVVFRRAEQQRRDVLAAAARVLVER